MAQCARLVEVGFDTDLQVGPQSPPSPGAGDVLVRVDACGVCHRDLIDRSGRFAWLSTPVIPGHEAAGTVIEVGGDVDTWVPGDRVATLHRDRCGACEACAAGQDSLCVGATGVFGLMVDGGYARYLIARPTGLYRLPDGMSPVDAAPLHCTFGTAWRGLVRQAQVRAGQRVLITGANGGVGLAAVQVAVRLGATVVAVVRDADAVERVRRQGAAAVIVSDDARFYRQLDAPVHAVLDCVGTPTFNGSLRSLGMGGRLVVVGNVTEERASVNLGFCIVRGLTVIGSSGATGADMAELLALHASRPLDLEAHREAVLPLEQADAAQRMVRAGGRRGRLVLDCRG